MKIVLILLGLAALASLGHALIKREVRYNEYGVKYFYDPDTGRSYYTGLNPPQQVQTAQVQHQSSPDTGRIYYTGLNPPQQVQTAQVQLQSSPDTGRSYYTGLIAPQQVQTAQVQPQSSPDTGRSYYTGLIVPQQEQTVQVQPQSSGGAFNLLTRPLNAAANIIDKTGSVANRVVGLPFDVAREVVSGVGLENTGLGKLANGVLDIGEGVEHFKVNLVSGVAQAPFKIASNVLQNEKREKRSVATVAAQCCANSGLIGSIQQELSLLRASVNSFDQRLNGLMTKLSQI